MEPLEDHISTERWSNYLKKTISVQFRLRERADVFGGGIEIPIIYIT